MRLPKIITFNFQVIGKDLQFERGFASSRVQAFRGKAQRANVEDCNAKLLSR